MPNCKVKLQFQLFSTYMYVADPGRKSNVTLLHISSVLPCLKCCRAEPPLRVGLVLYYNASNVVTLLKYLVDNV